MKYEYKTATGRHEIEVDEQFYDILFAMDMEEKNSDRKHSRRRPISLERADYEGEWFSDGTDILGGLIHSESFERLRAALAELTPEQHALIERIYIKNEKITDIAQAIGVSHVAIIDRLKRIQKKLKKSLS